MISFKNTYVFSKASYGTHKHEVYHIIYNSINLNKFVFADDLEKVVNEYKSKGYKTHIIN
jgi:hypothetical protein